MDRRNDGDAQRSAASSAVDDRLTEAGDPSGDDAWRSGVLDTARHDLDDVGATLGRLWAGAMADGPTGADMADRLATAARQVRLASQALQRHLLR